MKPNTTKKKAENKKDGPHGSSSCFLYDTCPVTHIYSQVRKKDWQ